MDPNKQQTTYTAQEVEENVTLDEVEKELESVERSFDSGDMQSFGRNKKDVMDRFTYFRRRDEEVFHKHCDAVLIANSLATAEGNKDNEEEDINEQKEQFIQVRKSIQEKTSELRKLLNEINESIAESGN